jgi:hypothetical protein
LNCAHFFAFRPDKKSLTNSEIGGKNEHPSIFRFQSRNFYPFFKILSSKYFERSSILNRAAIQRKG